MQHLLHVTNMFGLTLLCEVDPVCFESDGATENKVVVEDPPVWKCLAILRLQELRNRSFL